MTKKDNRMPGWRHRAVLKSFGRPPQHTLNRLAMSKRNKRIKITLPSIGGSYEAAQKEEADE